MRGTAKTVTIHPDVRQEMTPADHSFSGATLRCLCRSDAVEVRVCAHSKVCGCTMCWKPDAATFAQIAGVPSQSLAVVAHEDKLRLVDESAALEQHACRDCGVHM